MMTEAEIAKLHRVWKTVLTMLKDRGYLVGELMTHISLPAFVSKFGPNMNREDLVIHKTNAHNPSDQIYVFFPEEPKVGVKTIHTYVERMKSESVSRAILVVQSSITSFAKTSISEISAKLTLEVFQEAELLVNIKDHVLVPEHQPLTEEEKESLVQRYTVKVTQLPRIQVMDPIARYYGLKRGQVVRITRSSETAGKYVTYRYVI